MVNKLNEQNENIFDIYIYKFVDTQLDIYKKLGLTPNMITTFSLLSGCLSAYMVHKKKYKIAETVRFNIFI